MNVSASTRFFGRLQESEKQRLLASARCLVLPSRAEGFGLVYLEAMRLGRPCITGYDGGAEVAAPGAGIQVDARDPAALAGALVALLTCDDQWHARSVAARVRYEANFTAQHFRERLNQALPHFN
jgi:glycosyltransferase involved in cell wall biosynthesis